MFSTKKVGFKKNDNSQEKKRKEMENRIKHFASFLRYIQFGQIKK